jgi:hypothetical protein
VELRNHLRRAHRLALVAACISAFAIGRAAHGQVVNYAGSVSNQGAPVSSGFIIAGTFKPTFDPYSYKFVYGIDEFGNMNETMYSQAIADGNFIPIGSGALTQGDGSLTGSGIALGKVGQQVYLFAFNGPNPDLADNFALASHPAWVISNQGVSINTSQATQFVFGQPVGGALGLQVLPVPEPGSLALGCLALGSAVGWRRLARSQQ